MIMKINDLTVVTEDVEQVAANIVEVSTINEQAIPDEVKADDDLETLKRTNKKLYQKIINMD